MATVLREEREAQGLSQTELGQAAGVSQSQMSKLLRGERHMTLLQLVRMCDRLGLRPSAVLLEAEGR